jgi:hypothetical protein
MYGAILVHPCITQPALAVHGAPVQYPPVGSGSGCLSLVTIGSDAQSSHALPPDLASGCASFSVAVCFSTPVVGPRKPPLQCCLLTPGLQWQPRGETQ